MNGALDLVSSGQGRNPNVHHRLAVRRNDVGLDPAVHRPNVYRDAGVGIVQRKQLLNHVGKLQDGARPTFRIQPGMCGLAKNRDRKSPDSFAGGFYQTIKTHGRLKHKRSRGAACKHSYVPG